MKSRSLDGVYPLRARDDGESILSCTRHGKSRRRRSGFLLRFGSKPISSDVEQSSKEYLTFRVARKDLAVDAARVRAILPIEELIPLPNTRPDVMGAVKLTSGIAVVVDLSARLNLPAAAPGPQRRVVVVETAAGHMAGFVVDRVSNIIRYRSRDLRNGVLHGIGRSRRVVEVDQVVSEDDLVRLWSDGS
jgi:chemotaxis signal transduction protein